MDFIDEGLSKLAVAGLVDPDSILGCSTDEIASIEDAFDLTLPEAYSSFLSKAGKGCGDFLHGTDFLFPDILRNRQEAEWLLERCGSTWTLARHHFVFVQHHGYQFMYFDVVMGDDPPVFYYSDEAELPRQIFARFSEWFRQAIEDETAP